MFFLSWNTFTYEICISFPFLKELYEVYKMSLNFTWSYLEMINTESRNTQRTFGVLWLKSRKGKEKQRSKN